MNVVMGVERDGSASLLVDGERFPGWWRVELELRGGEPVGVRVEVSSRIFEFAGDLGAVRRDAP